MLWCAILPPPPKHAFYFHGKFYENHKVHPLPATGYPRWPMTGWPRGARVFDLGKAVIPTPIHDRQFWYPTASIAVERSFAPGVAAGGATPLLHTKKKGAAATVTVWLDSLNSFRRRSVFALWFAGLVGIAGVRAGLWFCTDFSWGERKSRWRGGARRGEKKWQHVGWWSSLRVESGCRGFQDLSTAGRYNPQERLLSH